MDDTRNTHVMVVLFSEDTGLLMTYIFTTEKSLAKKVNANFSLKEKG